jgi:hypothetical protein
MLERHRAGGEPHDGATDHGDRLSYPVAVMVWIGSGLVGWGLVAAVVLTIT